MRDINARGDGSPLELPIHSVTITAMLRVRNEARWISEVLASIHPLTRYILILDDHSIDDTPALCAAAGATVLHSPFPVGQTDEARDKSFLLDEMRDRWAPDYVLAIDGDEVLEVGAAPRILERLRPDVSVYSFPVRYLWGDRLHYRADGVYAKYQRASMFSLHGAVKPHFAATGYGCNFHCGNVPRGLPGHGGTIPVDLLHLGYMLAEDRIRKYHWYREHDPGNQYEDEYRHMVVGDVFPAESKFLHGGPLKVFTLPPAKWPAIDS